MKRIDPTDTRSILEIASDTRYRLNRLSAILMEWPENKDAEWALRYLVNVWFQQPGWKPEIILRSES